LHIGDNHGTVLEFSFPAILTGSMFVNVNDTAVYTFKLLTDYRECSLHIVIPSVSVVCIM